MTHPKWIAACLLINIVDGRQLDRFFECFTVHEKEKTDINYDELYKDLHKTTTIPKQSYMDYQASPSVQRRGHSKASLRFLTVVMLMTVRMPSHSTTIPYTNGKQNPTEGHRNPTRGKRKANGSFLLTHAPQTLQTAAVEILSSSCPPTHSKPY